MKVSDIRKYAGLMEELGLTGLEITEDNKVVRLERAAAPIAMNESVLVQNNAVNQTNNENIMQENQNYISIKSPIVGVFYSAPAENAEPYVSIGDRVEKGATLCIVEAMKLMNEITADESGVIEKICVTNGQVVEYGTELFRIRR